MSNDLKCPQCGALLKGNAPAGLCPNCLMALNLKTETVFTDDTSATQAPLPPEQIAPHFPQLEILECLGRGGMGVVYKARQKSLNRLVALKLLAPERVTDAKFAERFTREAHALAALNHPHIVTIHDFGQAGGFYFLLMEFVDGVNLRQLLAARKLEPEEALAIVPPLCDALQYAHERGIVHRDIKPANLLLDKGGRVKIADFGIAKMVGDSSSVDVAESQPAGTPQYMAPEQKHHQRTDHRADIYSLGVVLYEMLTGELPTDKLQPPSRKVQIDLRLDEIVLRALEKTPELRFATAAEFRTQVEAVTAPSEARPDTAHPSAAITPKTLTAATGVALFFGVLLFGVPFVDMFRVQKDSAYIVIIVCALVASIFTGFRVLSSLPLLKTPQWWFKPLSVVAFVAAAPAVGLATFFALNLPHGFNHPAPSEALLVSLSFVGAFTLPWAGLVLWRVSKPSGNAQRASTEWPGSPRISRLAVIGACWVPLCIAAGTAAWLVQQVSRDGSQPTRGQWAVLLPLLLLVAGGPFGTTILGWLSVAEISRSHGKVHGLKLAVFAGLVYPLMALSGILATGVTYGFHVLTNQPSAGLASVILAVALIVLVNVLIVRAVMRAVRREVAAAPREGSVTANQINLASLALIFALMSSGLGAFAALRPAGLSLTLALIFSGVAIFMAFPVRRVGAGKSALVVAALGMVLWPMAALIVVRAHSANPSNSVGVHRAEASDAKAGSVIKRIQVTTDQAIVQQRRFDGEGMIIALGSSTNRWVPGGVYLDAMFDITLKGDWLGQGATWSIKSRHGTRASYRLDGPPGQMLGKIIFNPSTPAPEADGSYLIGEFRPENGHAFPISVRLEKTGEETHLKDPNASALLPATLPMPGALATRPGRYELPQDLKLVITESAPAKADKGPFIDGQLVWGASYKSKAGQNYYDIQLSDGQPYAVAWSADGKKLWVTCAARLGDPNDTTFSQYLRILSIRGPGDVDEEIKDLEKLDAATAENLPGAMRDMLNAQSLTKPGALTSYPDAMLRSLTYEQFDQTLGKYWRAFADAERYPEAAVLIERYLALHPQLDLGIEAINGANLHFHAAQCRAFAVHTSGALKQLALAHHQQPTPGGLLWNDYLDGTTAFLLQDRAKLQEARDKLAAGPGINKPNAMALDRLIANFGKPYRDAYGMKKAEHVR